MSYHANILEYTATPSTVHPTTRIGGVMICVKKIPTVLYLGTLLRVQYILRVRHQAYVVAYRSCENADPHTDGHTHTHK